MQTNAHTFTQICLHTHTHIYGNIIVFMDVVVAAVSRICSSSSVHCFNFLCFACCYADEDNEMYSNCELWPQMARVIKKPVFSWNELVGKQRTKLWRPGKICFGCIPYIGAEQICLNATFRWMYLPVMENKIITTITLKMKRIWVFLRNCRMTNLSGIYMSVQ